MDVRALGTGVAGGIATVAQALPEAELAPAAAAAAAGTKTGPVQDAVRGVRALDQYRELRAILAKDRAAIDVDDLRRLASFEDDMRGPVHGLMQLPPPVRMSFGSLRHMPNRAWDIGRELDMLQGWSDRVETLARGYTAEHAKLLADPGVTRASLTAEVCGIVSRPAHEVTPEQLRRLAVIDTLPGSKRPGLPRPTRYSPELIVANERDPQHFQAGNELRKIRLWAEQRAIMADRSLTGPRLREEALAIASKDPDDVSFDEFVRLAAIQGVRDARGVGMPGRFGSGRIQNLPYAIESGWIPRHREEARQEFEALRIWADQVALDADATVTRAALERELLDIAIRPRSAIGADELRRVAAMDAMQGPARPAIAPAEDARDFRWLAVTDSTPGWSAAAQVEVAKLRPRERLLSDVGLDVIRARLARGGELDASVLAMLADDGDSTLARVGLSIDDLRRMSSDVLARAGRGDSTEYDVLLNLKAVRRELAEQAIDLGATVDGLRASTLELADRNIARMVGERSDTYGRHPDYAEVGRIVSNVELLRALRAAPDSAPAPGSMAEVLTW